MHGRARKGASFLLGFWLAPLAWAGAPEFGGFYKNQLSLSTVDDNFGNLGLTDKDIAVDDFQRLRLKLDWAPRDVIEFQIHYEIRFALGDTERIRNRLEAQTGEDSVGTFLSLPGRIRFLDLESEIHDGSNRVMGHDLDRLRARWVTGAMDVTVGRQAVSWGSGLIWTPTDLFSGFAPTEIDRDEKLGVDVARVIASPTPDTSWDLIAEPLDEDGPYEIDTDDSSLALRTSTHLGEYDIALLGGQVAGDGVIGGDFSGYLKDAGFRGEFIYTRVQEDDERDYTRGLVSLDYGFAKAWNPYVALEYFYNGLGAGDEDTYLTRLAATSVQRAFQRGNAFNLGRHYVGNIVGLTPSALWSVQAITLVNAGDGSMQEFASATRSVTDNIDLLFGVNIGLGGIGTEFGGFSVEQAGVEFKTADLFFVFLKVYF